MGKIQFGPQMHHFKEMKKMPLLIHSGSVNSLLEMAA